MLIALNLSKSETSQYLDSLVSSLCGQRGPQFDQYSDVWTLTEFWESNDAWKAFFKARRTSTGSGDAADPHLESLPVSQRAAVEKVWERRSSEILQVLLKETDSISGAVLTDFDWNVKLVLGSDKVASLGVPLAGLDLWLSHRSERRHVSLEMTSSELLRLINAVEAAHKAALQFKV